MVALKLAVQEHICNKGGLMVVSAGNFANNTLGLLRTW
jgi:hypothetical protein